MTVVSKGRVRYTRRVKKPVRLLLADDTEIVRRAILQVVADVCEGVQVIGEARDYDELMQMAPGLNADIVLMDINMPAREPVQPDVLSAAIAPACLLAMSAWSDDETAERARECGAVELLDKTKLGETLLPAIERYVGSKGRGAVR
jgi:DNA-binding NarL/FixJ family response regulator